MKINIQPLHEVILAAGVMAAGLVAAVWIALPDRGNRDEPAIPDDIYTGPVLQIKGASQRITGLLANHVILGNLDQLYHPPPLPPSRIVPEKRDEKKEPVASKEPQAREVPLRLTGIAWSLHHPLAFINGRGLTNGDVVAGRKVLRITNESVLLETDDGRKEELTLRPVQTTAKQLLRNQPSGGQR